MPGTLPRSQTTNLASAGTHRKRALSLIARNPRTPLLHPDHRRDREPHLRPVTRVAIPRGTARARI